MDIRAALILLFMMVSGCFGGSSPIPSASTAPTTSLKVVVTDIELKPMSGATVTMLNLDETLVTSGEGVATFKDVPPGNWTVDVRAPGFLATNQSTETRIGTANQLNFTLHEVPPDLFDAETMTGAGSCNGSTGPLSSDSGGCGTSVAVLPTTKKSPPRPDVFNVSLQLLWSTPESLQFKISLENETPIPFSDGSLNLTVEGPSPLRVDIPNQMLSRAMRVGFPKIHAAAIRILGSPPSSYSISYDVLATVWHITPAAPRADYRPFTTRQPLFDGTLVFPRAQESSSPPAPLHFRVPVNGSMVRVVPTVAYDCPAGYGVKAKAMLADSNGRSITVFELDASYPDTCTPGATTTAVGPAAWLWKESDWTASISGQCTCKVRFAAEADD